jgi:hypothetical protein
MPDVCRQQPVSATVLIVSIHEKEAEVKENYQSFLFAPTGALYIYYIKIYIKIHIKIAPTCFGLTIILREHIIDLS